MQYIHPSAILTKHVKLGSGVFIGPNCSIGFPGFQFYQREDESIETVIGDNSIIMGNSVVCLGSKIGANSRLDYHSYVGVQASIGEFCVVEYGGRIYDKVEINSRTTISGFICNYAIIGSNSIVQGELLHKFKDVDDGQIEPPPVVGNECFIGKKALIVGHIEIASGSYVSAGSIVTKSTKAYKLYSGNPAKEIGNAPKSYLSGVSQFNEKRIKEIHEIINRYTKL